MLRLLLLAQAIGAAVASPVAPEAANLPYYAPDITGFTPTQGQYVVEDGEYAAKVCTYLGEKLPTLIKDFKFREGTTFGHYYQAGANPSLELLVATYPPGIINATVQAKLPDILSKVGPDIDLNYDMAYGRMTPELANHRPMGGMPPFCRTGGVVMTSDLTETLWETWLPVQMTEDSKLVPFNQSDFPTNSTPIYIDKNGKLVQLPTHFDDPKPPKAPTPGSDKSGAQPAKDGGQTKADSGTPVVKGTTQEKETADTMVPQVRSKKRALRTDDVANGRKDRVLDGDKVLGRGIGWNGRKVHINNGGQRGFVPLPDCKQLVARYGFVCSGSNAGHFSDTADVKWVIGPQRVDTIEDWAHRSQYVTTLLSQKIIDIFYGPQSGVRVTDSETTDARPATLSAECNEPTTKDRPTQGSDVVQHGGPLECSRVRSYLLGVSVGGGSAFGAIQTYGPQWDGALIGAPTIRFSDLNFAQIETAKTHRKDSVSDAVFNATIFGNQFHQEVLEQCDGLDGVRDGIITEPWNCHIDYIKAIQCGGGGRYSDDKTVCFTPAQVANLEKLYAGWKYEGRQFCAGWPLGAEEFAHRYVNTATKAYQWYQFAIQGKLTNDSKIAYSNGSDGGGFKWADVEFARRANVGNSNFALTDLSAFFGVASKGKSHGKILHYHGGGDFQISNSVSIEYHNAVREDPANGGKEFVDSNYKFYHIPGMDHGRDGSGAWHFGGPTQNDAGNRPLRYDTKHDMVLALIAWVEQELEPTYQIGAAYDSKSIVLPADDDPPKDNELLPTKFQSFGRGIEFTRPHCPWPQVAKYKGGPTKGVEAWKSFECA